MKKIRLIRDYKILLITHGDFPGAVAPIPKEIAKQLYLLNIAVEVLSINGVNSEPQEIFPFKIHFLKCNNLFQLYKKIIKIVINFDIIHYFPGKKLELLPLFCHKKKFIFNFISVSVTGNVFLDFTINFLKKLQPFFASTNIYTDKELYINLKPLFRKNFYFLPVGYASELFYPCSKFKTNKKKYLIYHGSLNPKRKIENIITILKYLPNDYEIFIIGKIDYSYYFKLMNLANKYNIKDRIFFKEVSQKDIIKFINISYLCISYVPTIKAYQNQFVLKTIEYLACNRPVITTNTTYNLEFQKNIGDSNILISPDDPYEMAKIILNSNDHIDKFYNLENLSILNKKLKKYTNSLIISERILNIYDSTLKN